LNINIFYVYSSSAEEIQDYTLLTIEVIYVDVEYGRFKWFNHGRGFGFIKVLDDQREETGEELFFHISNGRFVEFRNREPKFAGKTIIVDGVSTKLPLPETGDEVVFIRTPSDKGGNKASPWTYKEYWIRESRPPVKSLHRSGNKKRHCFFLPRQFAGS
jgi:cold shock CspA family protein